MVQGVYRETILTLGTLGGFPVVVNQVAETIETKIVVLATTNAPGILGVVQGDYREAILTLGTLGGVSLHRPYIAIFDKLPDISDFGFVQQSQNRTRF